MNYSHADSVVKNTTYWLILIIPDNAYVFEIWAPIEKSFATFRFVKITLHPRVKKLDLNNIGPKALRDEIYRGLEQLSGLETLNQIATLTKIITTTTIFTNTLILII